MRRLSRFLAGTLALSALAIARAQDAASSLKIDEAGASLIASGDHLVFRLPIHAVDREHTATVSAELLDTLDLSRSQASSTCRLRVPNSVCEVALAPATPEAHHPHADGDDLPLYRVRYKVSVPGEPDITGILAVANIAPSLYELHVAAPKDLRAGEHYIARVRAIHPRTHQPIANVVLSASVSATSNDEEQEEDKEEDKKDHKPGSIHVVTDADGFASIPFTVPAGADVTSLDVEVAGAFGSFELSTTQTLRIATVARLDLTTDKPLYQPGQTLHARLLVLDRNAHAATNKTIQLDVRDPGRTLVYRSRAVTSAYGIATVDWAVPARLRLGEYSLLRPRCRTSRHTPGRLTPPSA